MTELIATLWDLLRRERGGRGGGAASRAKNGSASARAEGRSARSDRRTPMRDRYDALVQEMKARYGLRIRKWRTSTSGCAWEVHYSDGSITRLIESPYPTGPISCAVFLHEVGHHAIGLHTYKPRCLEEYHAWMWSLTMMREWGFNVTPAVEKRMVDALRYAVRKAQRRGLRELPEELRPFV